MRWDWHIIACGVAVVALGFALGALDGAHRAFEQAQAESTDVER